MILIGVSPAFYLSRYGTHFTMSDLLESMSTLAEWGFDSIQLEIFHPEQMDEWSDENCGQLKNRSTKTGLHISQFCAHFLLASFDSPESLYSDSGYKEAEYIGGKLIEHELTRYVTIPLPAFKGDVNNPEVQKRFDEKVKVFQEILSMRNIYLAFEPQPESLGADLQFLNRHQRVGLNLDPGHLLCSGIDPFSLDQSVLSRVMATHLCENDGKDNLSLTPGTFYQKNWGHLLGKLVEAGYQRSFDLEIICPSGEVEEAYREGQFFLKDYVYKINNAMNNPALHVSARG